MFAVLFVVNAAYVQWIDSRSIKTHSKLPPISWLHCDFYWFSIESTSVLCTAKSHLMNTMQAKVLLCSNGFCFELQNVASANWRISKNFQLHVKCAFGERKHLKWDWIEYKLWFGWKWLFTQLVKWKFQSISKRFWTLLIFHQRINVHTIHFNSILNKFYYFELACRKRYHNLLMWTRCCWHVCASQFEIGMFVLWVRFYNKMIMFSRLVHLIYFNVCGPTLSLCHELEQNERIFMIATNEEQCTHTKCSFDEQQWEMILQCEFLFR